MGERGGRGELDRRDSRISLGGGGYSNKTETGGGSGGYSNIPPPIQSSSQIKKSGFSSRKSSFASVAGVVAAENRDNINNIYGGSNKTDRDKRGSIYTNSSLAGSATPATHPFSINNNVHHNNINNINNNINQPGGEEEYEKNGNTSPESSSYPLSPGKARGVSPSVTAAFGGERSITTEAIGNSTSSIQWGHFGGTGGGPPPGSESMTSINNSNNFIPFHSKRESFLSRKFSGGGGNESFRVEWHRKLQEQKQDTAVEQQQQHQQPGAASVGQQLLHHQQLQQFSPRRISGSGIIGSSAAVPALEPVQEAPSTRKKYFLILIPYAMQIFQKYA